MDVSDRNELLELGALAGVMLDAFGNEQWLLIGAWARDLHLHYRHGISIDRATVDVDIGIAVSDWEHYARVRQTLLDKGRFSADPNVEHRLMFNRTVPIDLVPFGGLAASDRTISWPSDGSSKMSVIGIDEALKTADSYKLPGAHVVKVVCLPVYILLKIIAWSERHDQRPQVDATDMLMVLANYIDCGNQQRLYGDDRDLIEEQNFDYQIAGATMAGRDLKSLLANDDAAPNPVIMRLQEIIQPQLESEYPGRLLREVSAHRIAQFERLLAAFMRGLTEPGRD